MLSCERRPDLLIGCDSLFVPCLSIGGVGEVSGPGALFCERFTRLYKQYGEGDYTGAMATQQQIVVTDRKLEGIPGIPALKTLLKLRGVIKCDACRAPLRPLNEDEIQKLSDIWEEYKREEHINE